MPKIQGIPRDTTLRFSLEELIAANNPVRAIDAFVEALNLEALGFQHKGKSSEGRPAYTAKILLKLYCYGYFNGIRSSRKLQQECERNIELWWLLERQQPRYHTIADFRKHNKAAFEKTFKQLVKLCREWQLFGGETVAIDGSKFRAQNSKKNNYNEKKVEQHLAYIDKKVAQYTAALDKLDEEESVKQAPEMPPQKEESESSVSEKKRH